MSIDISDEVSEEWTSMFERWNWRDKERPKQLIKLVRKGNYSDYTVEPVCKEQIMLIYRVTEFRNFGICRVNDI